MAEKRIHNPDKSSSADVSRLDDTAVIRYDTYRDTDKPIRYVSRYIGIIMKCSLEVK